MTEYTDPTGQAFELDEDTIADLKALAHLTRQHTNEVAAQAIEQLRNTLIPSTREPATRAPRTSRKPAEPKP
jgi:predicted transcriptional regulator